ncbi:unnamed protein product [Polarella glacialis]|uniref:Uncharacterized protein n=1 Tax=Polarella glacialis TaxID=89957 RepID=A0A813G1G3_POLGL|nr:unnamed protein product [Polarella glacialis]
MAKAPLFLLCIFGQFLLNGDWHFPQACLILTGEVLAGWMTWELLRCMLDCWGSAELLSSSSWHAVANHHLHSNKLHMAWPSAGVNPQMKAGLTMIQPCDTLTLHIS